MPPVEDEYTVIPPEFDIFVPTTDDQLKNIITCAPVTTCSLDPLPGWLFKDTLACTLPTITDIINRFLVSGIVPDGMKKALVRPLLKKPSLHQNVLKNYRPVSNLPYISKLLERVVAAQLNHHMTINALHEPLQSACKPGHSTETALIQVHNDILSAMDTQQLTILVLLDLSSIPLTIKYFLIECSRE